MKIEKYSNNKSLYNKIIQDELNNFEDDEDFIYGGGLYLEDLLKNHEQSYIISENNLIYAAFDLYKYSDLEIASLKIFNSEKINDIINSLYNYMPEAIIEINDYIHCKLDNYNIATFNSNINPDITYNTKYNNTYMVPKSINANILGNVFEKSYFPELNKSKLTFEDISAEDLINNFIELEKKDIIFGLPTAQNKFNHTNIAGFHYFNTLDDSDSNKKFLVCKQDNIYIGAIKHGIYENFYTPKHEAIAYIDVNMKYRNNGIATMMIKELDQHLTKDIPLFLTSESEMGKMCNMKKLFKKYITSTDVIAYDEQENYIKNINNNINER